jgi:hypothetical protein
VREIRSERMSCLRRVVDATVCRGVADVVVRTEVEVSQAGTERSHVVVVRRVESS